MKTWRIENGVLICQPWSFSRTDARHPHRHYVLANYRAPGKVRLEFSVLANRKKNRFWLTACGPGFAGDRSKRINTVGTSSPAIAQQWRDCLDKGRAVIESQ